MVVSKRNVHTLDDLSKTGDFDSQLFLFEAVGFLISIESIPVSRQQELLTLVIMPLLQRIEEIVQIQSATTSAAIDLVLIGEMGDLISCIGCISKGFPDTTKQDGGSFWTLPFKTTLQGVVIVLSKFNSYAHIRNAARFTFQRMTGCMGLELLEYVPMFLSAGLLASETTNELIEFLPFVGLIIYKYQVFSSVLFFSNSRCVGLGCDKICID